MKKKVIKWVLWGLLAGFVAIQFFPPKKNIGEAYGPNDVSNTVPVPADVKGILEKSCNDCHSGHTEYPWYTNIQPVGWWMAEHVEDGKRNVDFTVFDTYKLKRKLHKFDEIVEQMKEDEMPLSSYTLIHQNTKLTEQEKQILIDWAVNSKALLDTVKLAKEK